MFDKAIALFQQGDFRQAREQFERAAGGPRREMALAATLRARMCERRLAQAAPRPQSAEEHYAYAVALINERRWKEAEEHLNKALAQNPNADHVYYSLALCRGRCGDMEGAYSSLKRAIELQPRNLVAARNDPDFARLNLEPPLSELLRPGR